MRTTLLTLLVSLLLTSCNIDRSKANFLAEAPKTWFVSLQQNIFNPKCAQCHNPQKASAGLDVTSYESWMASGKIVKHDCKKSPVFKSLMAGRMPLNGPKLSAQELQSIASWIDNGASATALTPNTPLPPPVFVPPPVLKATYSSIRSIIFEARCVGCHSGPKPKGDLDLTTYRKIFSSSGVVTPGEPLESSLLQRLLSDTDPMPPKPRPPVTETEITVIEAWIKNGALEN